MTSLSHASAHILTHLKLLASMVGDDVRAWAGGAAARIERPQEERRRRGRDACGGAATRRRQKGAGSSLCFRSRHRGDARGGGLYQAWALLEGVRVRVCVHAREFGETKSGERERERKRR
jgi:hypothetical protein